MTYKVNIRDIEFNLFDYLKIQSLGKSEKFQGLGQEDFQAILDEGLKFALKEISPLNGPADQIGCKFENDIVFAPPGFKEVYQSYAANGFLALDAAADHGGQGLPISLWVGVNEFFVGSCPAFSMYPTLSRGAGHLIETFGDENIANTYVSNMHNGRWAGTMCLTEPQAGSAVGDITTTAVKEGDHYKIKGGKIFISGGDQDMTENIIHLV